MIAFEVMGTPSFGRGYPKVRDLMRFRRLRASAPSLSQTQALLSPEAQRASRTTQSRARSSIARTLRPHERGQAKRLAATQIERAQNVVDFFQMSFSIVIGS